MTAFIHFALRGWLAAIFLAWSTSLTAQDVTVHSPELERLIWTKINDRLLSLGKQPIPRFETGSFHAYAERVAEGLHPPDAPFEHSDSIGFYIGGFECIHRTTVTSTPAHSNDLIQAWKAGNLAYIADCPFEGWVNSPDHERAISMDNYASSTVACVITYNEAEGRFRVTSVWLSNYAPDFCCFSRDYLGERTASY